MKRYCFALDLKDNPEWIGIYENFHLPGNVWPEVLQSLKDADIQVMEIYRTGNRLFMIMETSDNYHPQLKAEADLANGKVQEWETLMMKIQQFLPWSKEGEKWVEMNRFFNLEEHQSLS